MKKQPVTAIMQSVLAALFGVQKSRNYHRDVTRGQASHYIVAGLVATVFFVLSLLGLVQLVLHFSQP